MTLNNRAIKYHFLCLAFLKVVDHYENPRNVGSLDKNKKNVGTGLVGAPACGDVMKLQVSWSSGAGIHYSLITAVTTSNFILYNYVFDCMLFPDPGRRNWQDC